MAKFLPSLKKVRVYFAYILKVTVFFQLNVLTSIIIFTNASELNRPRHNRILYSIVFVNVTTFDGLYIYI